MVNSTGDKHSRFHPMSVDFGHLTLLLVRVKGYSFWRMHVLPSSRKQSKFDIIDVYPYIPNMYLLHKEIKNKLNGTKFNK